MIAALVMLAAAGSSGAGAPADVRWNDASVDPGGELLSGEFVDADGDGALELCLVVTSAGRREIRIHRVAGARLESDPWVVVPVLEDVLAFGFGDVRAEPGRELLFLTGSGAWSYSPRLEGYRDNIQRLAEADLIYDVSDPRELPRWRYVLGGFGEERDHVLLPERGGYSIWAPAETPPEDPRAASHVAVAEFQVGDEVEVDSGSSSEDSGGGEVRMDGGGVTIVVRESNTMGILLTDTERRSQNLLSDRRSYPAPALIDVDGDGLADVLRLREKTLEVHLGRDGGVFSAAPDRTEPLPDYLWSGDSFDAGSRSSTSTGTARRDVLARKDDEADGFENSKVDLHILINDGTRLLPPQPSQILRFEAAEMRVDITDVDGDGRTDLAIRKFTLPSLVDTVTGLKFDLTYLLYLGSDGDRPFERKPALKQTETFDENTVQGAIANRHMKMDCDGDGIADLVEVDVQGRIAIRRLKQRKSFFGGRSWSLDEGPWKRFDARGSIEVLRVRDLNGDGLADVVSSGEDAFTVLLSSRGGNE